MIMMLNHMLLHAYIILPITGQVRENVGKWLVKSDKVKERTFTMSDIKEGSSVEFRVSAVNKAGQGPPSAASTSAKYGQPAQFSFSPPGILPCGLYVPLMFFLYFFFIFSGQLLTSNLRIYWIDFHQVFTKWLVFSRRSLI